MLTNRVAVARGAVSSRASAWQRIAKLASQVAVCAGLLVAGSDEAFAQLYWNNVGTSGTLSAAVWGTSPTGPFTTAWSSGTTIAFTTNSSITGAGTTVKGITVSNSSTVAWTGGGTLNTGSTIAIVDVGAGSVLNMTSQTISSVTSGNSTGFIKNGAGTWSLTNSIGSGAATLGFTLNAGRIITTFGNNLGSGPLMINGGTWEASGNSSYTATSVTVGGDFAMEGTGNNALTAANGIALGGSTRVITNNAGGTGIYRTLLGVISGSSGVGLTIGGTGNTYIGNTGNTFSGPVTVIGGELFFNGGTALGTGTTVILDGGRITSGSVPAGSSPTLSGLTNGSIDSTKTIYVGGSAGTSIGVQSGTGVLTFNGVIGDKPGSTGSWAKAGGGTLVLGGVSTYTGSTALTNGTLQLASGSNRLPTSTVVSLGQAASSNLGTLDLNGNSQQIAGLASVAGSNGGVSTNTVTSTSAATLTINVASGAFTYSAGSAANSGAITGAISVVKNGAGTQILGGSNGYTGSTTVNAGLLQINGPQVGNGAATVSGGELKVNGSLGTSTVTLNGGVLSGAGSVGAVTVNSGATLSPGNSPGTLTTGAVTFAGGGNYNWQLYDSNGLAGTDWDFINSTGSLTINATSGSPFNVNLWTLSGTGPDVNGSALNFNAANNKTWTIGTFSGGITGTSAGWYTINTGSFNGTSGFANSFAGTFSLATSGNNLNLIYNAPALTTSDYTAGTGNWSTGANWADGNPPSGPGLAITFSGPGGTSTNDGQLASLTGMTFTGSASGSYVVTGSALSIGGAGVVNSSSSLQTVQNVLTATAATVVNASAGNLTLSGATDNGGFGLTLQGANAISLAAISGTGTLSKIEAGTATLNGTVDTNNILVTAGTLALGAANRLADTAAVSVSGSAAFDLGGFTDTVASITMSGNATLANGTLTATTYALGGGTVSGNLGGGTLTNTGVTALNGTAGAGVVNLNAGVLTLGSASRLAGTPVVTGSSAATLALGGSETIASLAGGAAVTLGSATLTLGSDNSSTTYSGLISGSGGLTKNGTGTLTFSGSNTFTGPTLINAGLVGFSSASSSTFASSISGSGGIAKSGAGTLTLSGTNTYSGGTTISEGTLAVAAAANLTTSGSIGVTGGALLRFAGSATFGIAGQQLVLSAMQSTAPIINLTSGGTSTFLGDVALASGTNRIELTSTASLTLAGNITGPGVIWKRANGTLTLSGTGNTFDGGVIIGTGRLVVAAGSGLGSGSVLIDATSGTATLQLDESVSVGNFSSTIANSSAVTIAASKTLTVNQTTNATFSGDISGAGGFTKAGAAALTFTGSNTYAGPTTVTGGSLTFSLARTFPTTGTVTVTNGGGVILDSSGTYGGVGQSLVLSATQSTNPVLSTTSNATLTFRGDVNLASGVNRIEANGSSGMLTLSGNLSGAGTLMKQASGNLILSGTGSTATGGTQIGTGTLTVNAGSRLGTGDLFMNQTSANTATLALGESVTVGNLSSGYSTGTTVGGGNVITIASGKLFTATQTATGSFGADGTGNDTGRTTTITGSGGFTKAGAAALTFAGANSYTGLTTIAAGTLALSGNGSIGTGGLNLGTTGDPGTFDLMALTAGTYSLPATGDLTGAGTLAGSGKSLAVLGSFLPGNSPGTVTVNSGFTLDLSNSLGSTFEITSPLYPAGSYDLVTGAGSVTFGGVLNLNFSGGSYADGSNVLDLFDVSGGLAGSFTSVNATGLGAGQSATFNAATGFVSIVPEPGSMALAGVGAVLIGLAALKKRRRAGDSR